MLDTLPIAASVTARKAARRRVVKRYTDCPTVTTDQKSEQIATIQQSWNSNQIQIRIMFKGSCGVSWQCTGCSPPPSLTEAGCHPQQVFQDLKRVPKNGNFLCLLFLTSHCKKITREKDKKNK